ncbi:hypothetical protein SAY87_018834 [Trapa incisa]|uniref:Uncharacterized protein n=1 Tax=Trapa incisa TaxID=236973 RepID=A0AAN7Q1B5_9MYRT|nr:hypothetical protein SAY87_018834 [Trapa incisa]
MVPKIWEDDTEEQMRNIVDIVRTKLIDMYNTNLHTPLSVNITINTVTVLKPDEDNDDSNLIDYFNELEENEIEDAEEDDDAIVFERSTISLSSLVPTHDFDGNDYCTICMDNFDHSNDDTFI